LRLVLLRTRDYYFAFYVIEKYVPFCKFGGGIWTVEPFRMRGRKTDQSTAKNTVVSNG
jgi:hypothetical protein